MEQDAPRTGDFFDELKLHVGDRLQLEVPSPHHDLRYFTTLVGYVKGLSVLVRTPIVNGLPLPMRDRETIVLRGFSGVEAFSFEATVSRVCLAPFSYLHLNFPHKIHITPVRHEVRVKVSLPVKITRDDRELASHGTVTNISTNGILIDCDEDVGTKGDVVIVSFRFTIQPHDYDAHIESNGVIQNMTLQDNPSGSFIFQYGVKLQDLHSSQAILLQNLIYQRLLEDHHNVA